MNNLTICIDMDGVIVNFTKQVCKMIKNVFDINLNYDDVKKPRIDLLIRPYLTEKLHGKSEKEFEQLFSDKIFSPGFFLSLEPYKDAIEAVKMLNSLGHKIIFLTKASDWKYCSSEKVEWLNKYFGDMDYSLIMVSHMNDKHMIKCDCLIDDDPRALVNLSPYYGICIERPWNKEFRKKTYEGITAKSMKEAAEWLIENKEFMSSTDRGGIDAPKSKES